MKRVKFVSLLMASLVLLMAAGCGGSTNDGTENEGEIAGNVGKAEMTIVFWNGFTGPDGDDINKIIADVNKAFEGEIAIKTQTMPWDNFYDQFRTVVANGEAPDIAIMSLDNIASYANYGVLTPLEDLSADIGLDAE